MGHSDSIVHPSAHVDELDAINLLMAGIALRLHIILWNFYTYSFYRWQGGSATIKGLDICL